MKKAITIVIILMATSISRAATKTETVDGITWSFETKWDGQNYVEIYKWNSGYYPVISTSTIGSITVPDWLGGAIVRHIGQSAFLGCSGITSITIPDRVTIDDRAFSGCSGLADKDGFVIIRDVLYDYVGNQPDIVVPGNVRIGGYAFNACDILENVVIPDGIKDIGVSSFSESKRLAQLSIPNSVTNIGQTAFSGCSALTCVTIPQCVCLKTMSAIFPSYQSITNVIIAEGVSTIGAECFSGCESLQSITLPQSVTSIREKAFKDCINLKTVRFLGNAPDAEENIFQGTPRTLTVQVEGGSIGWSGGVSTVLPSSWYDRAIAYADGSGSGGTGQVDPAQPVVTNLVYTTVTNEVHHYSTVTNYIYSTVTNYVFSTVTNEVFHYSTVTNEIFHYTTVTNVVKYVPEPGASPDAGYGINVGAGSETVIAGAAGWDAFGVPDGMEWNKETGTLSGRAKLSGAYDLILVSGSGADTKIMRTTLTVAPYDTIIGYVGVAFSQSGAPLDNLKSYKTLPAGLKWKNDVLQGVPTKAQTLDLETMDGEPVKIEIKALPDSVVGTFDGCVYFPPSDPTNGVANTCDIGGTITLTATAAGKISASVKTAKKTYSFSMASWAKFAEGDAFMLEASAELKTGEVLEVNATVRDGATMVLAKLSGGEFGDAGCVTILMKDVYAKNGSKWIDEEAHGLMAKCKGTYQFGFDAVEESNDGGHGVTALPAWTLRPVAKVEASFLKVVLKDTGVATITGTLPDKTKVNLSAKATASAADGSDKVEIEIVSAAFPGKATVLPVEIDLMNDGSFAEGRENCGIIYSVKQ